MALSTYKGSSTIRYIGEAPGLTPERSTYLDLYNFSTNDIPQLRNAIIEKYDSTITGMVRKFSAVEQLTAMKYTWSEKERTALTYDDCSFNATTGALTRAASAPVSFRKHEKVQLHTSAGMGTFIVTTVTSATQVILSTYDTASLTLATDTTSVLAFSLGIEVGMGSLDTDFTTGIKIPYTVLDNLPAITREIYKENGSVVLNAKWVEVDGRPMWYLAEIDETRRKFLEAIEKKHVNGTEPAATSYAAATMGLQGTKGIFSEIAARGTTWTGSPASLTNLDDL